MYMMGLGGKPVGECFFTPPDKEGVAWLMGHYYAGGNVKLLKFTAPVPSPQEGSIEYRVRELEDEMFYLKKYAESFIKDLCSATGVTFKTYEAYKPSAGSPPPHEDVTPESEYLISSHDLYSSERGW